jgi:hypothetical protein
VVLVGLVFQVADRELDDGVLAVLCLDDLQWVGVVGDEREIPPIWPQLCLRADETGAARSAAVRERSFQGSPTV